MDKSERDSGDSVLLPWLTPVFQGSGTLRMWTASSCHLYSATAKDRCHMLAGTQSRKELVRYPRWMHGQEDRAPRVRKMHNEPGSFLSHSNPDAKEVEGMAGVTAP